MDITREELWGLLSDNERYVMRITEVGRHAPLMQEIYDGLVAKAYIEPVPASLTLHPGEDYRLTDAGRALLPGAGDVSGDDKYYLKETTDSDWREVSMEEFTRAEAVNGQVTYKASDTALYAWVGKNDMRGKIEPATEAEPTTDGKPSAGEQVDGARPFFEQYQDYQIRSWKEGKTAAGYTEWLSWLVADRMANPPAPTHDVTVIGCKRCNTEPAVAAGLCAGCVAALEEETVVMFRWLYAAVVDKAQECLAQANAKAESGVWPAGQGWGDLADSSRSVFLHLAREAMHISHDDFLAIVRKHTDEVDDIYDNGSSALTP